MKVLHIIRHPDDARALATAAAQQDEHAVTVLLIQDGVRAALDLECEVVVCREDAVAAGIAASCQTLAYEDIVALIFDSDCVVTW